MKICYKCGASHDTPQKMCKACYNAYMRIYLLERWKERRARGIRILGGVCIDCGATEELEFDHIDPKLKSFAISSRPGCSEEKFLSELAKCVLRCNSCHLERSREQRSMPHGIGNGRRNCSCEPCRQKVREYMNAYNAKRRTA